MKPQASTNAPAENTASVVRVPLLTFIGGGLIVLGVLVVAVVQFGLGAIHQHAHWFLESRWGPVGELRLRDDAYDSLYHWAVHATRKGTQAEQLLGFSIALFLVLFELLLCAWGRDRKRLRMLRGSAPER